MKRGWALIGVVAACCAAAGPLRAQRWRMQYFYDEDRATLVIADLQFASATRGVAVGSITSSGHSRKPVQLLTADGGAHWTQTNLEENPVSLFFLNESLGWMVTEKGLWVTTEMGRNWRRLAKPPADLLRVGFVDEKHGFGVGFKKKVIETKDGGEHWTPVEAADEPPGEANFSIYNWIQFPTAHDGMIAGLNLPPKRTGAAPDWLDPEMATSRRDTPHLSYSLSTHDGGTTWKSGAASLFGEITRVRLMPDGSGLGLIEYSNSFAYPAEVKRINWHTGKSDTVYRDKRLDVSDVWLTPDGTAYLAGMQVAGEIHDVLRSKVQVLRSKDMSVWEDMPVDYRASATSVMLAGSGESMWMATDQGMILKLEPAEPR